MTPKPLSENAGKASDHLANERTFLAWVRTSISIIVFGFVVAKFGITLRQFMRVQGSNAHESGVTLMMGVAFMLTGILMAIMSLVRYRKTMMRLDAGEFQPAGASVTALGLMAAIFGAVLAAYLIYTARTL